MPHAGCTLSLCPVYIQSREIELETMPTSSFQQRFIDFCEYNRQLRTLELEGESGSSTEILSGWHEALTSFTDCYQQGWERELMVKALADPYFPLSKLRKLNVDEFATESGSADLAEESLAKIMAGHLLSWAEIFLAIRQDLRRLNNYGLVAIMKLPGSPQETLPEIGWCDYCGGCCEIRGGPPEFTGPFQPPSRWYLYFRGDGCKYQRFCPFLFEYFATAKFFCAIYRIKPKCCWDFDLEECEFLQNDVAREQAEKSRISGA